MLKIFFFPKSLGFSENSVELAVRRLSERSDKEEEEEEDEEVAEEEEESRRSGRKATPALC